MPATDARAQPHYLYSPIIHWKLGKEHTTYSCALSVIVALHQFLNTNFLGLLINILWLFAHEFEVKSTA
jgi:hypothetical protein